MGAQPRYINKYTQSYRKRFPTSPILLLRQDGGDLFWRPTWLQVKNMEPAVSVVRAMVDQSHRSPKVLLHIFSNGGSYTACQLADVYHNSLPSSGVETRTLPISALILDSTPSLPNSRAAHSAISEMLPKKSPVVRAVAGVLLWVYIGFGLVVDKVLAREDLVTSLRRKLNSGAFTQDELKRVYIYSQADHLIPARDIESHAEDARAVVGKDRVQLEDFGTTRHVGHVMGNEPRYWGLVENLWRESMQKR
jgi:hypothetical protein